MVEISDTGVTMRQVQLLRAVLRTGSERHAAKGKICWEKQSLILNHSITPIRWTLMRSGIWGSVPDIVVQVDANGHEAGLIAAGLGISITNSIVARECILFGLHSRPFEPSATYHYIIFWQKGRQLTDGLQFAVEQLAKAFD